MVCQQRSSHNVPSSQLLGTDEPIFMQRMDDDFANGNDDD